MDGAGDWRYTTSAFSLKQTIMDIQNKCSCCVYFRHGEDVFDGYDDVGLLSIPRMKTIPAHCSIGCVIYQPQCENWKQEHTLLDEMINKANQIIEIVNAELR